MAVLLLHASAMSKETAHQTNDRYLASLMIELFQTERSAIMHCDREAARLGKSPPATTLDEVSDHAREALAKLTDLAEAGKIPARKPRQKLGQLIGRTLSRVRMHVLDRLVAGERSYRGTLLGMRHGIDLVRLLREVADREGTDVLVEWCDDWLSARVPLVEAVCEHMVWFADRPASAVHHGARPAAAAGLAAGGRAVQQQ